MKYFVGVYDCYQACGGSEEGGWYYTAGELVRPLKEFDTEEEADNFVNEETNRICEETGNMTYRESYRKAVNYGMRIGWYSVMGFEGGLPKYFPDRTPRYE